jgi:hypothetical protein
MWPRSGVAPGAPLAGPPHSSVQRSSANVWGGSRAAYGAVSLDMPIRPSVPLWASSIRGSRIGDTAGSSRHAEEEARAAKNLPLDTRFACSGVLQAASCSDLISADKASHHAASGSDHVTKAVQSPDPREAGARRVCPAIGFCASPGLSNNGLQPVPWFHENALLEVDGRGVAATEDGAGCAAGDKRVAGPMIRCDLL